MAEQWLEKLRSAQKTCLIQDGKRKVHFTFPDATELAEEYDVKTDDLLVRKWKRRGTLGGAGRWEVEIGETASPAANLDIEGMVESSANPIFVRKDTKACFQWRIRNLPYPKDNYILSVKPEDKLIVISTKNKKYYKKFGVPDLERIGLELDPRALEVAHANNTLIVSYRKPPPCVELERRVAAELRQLKAAKDGDVDCTPS